NVYTGLLLEQRKDVAEQTGVLRRSGRGNHDGFILRRSERDLRKGKGNHKREISHRGSLIEALELFTVESCQAQASNIYEFFSEESPCPYCSILAEAARMTARRASIMPPVHWHWGKTTPAR